MTPRRIHLNAFDMTCAGHQAPGLWRHPEDQSHRYRDLRYWTDLARLLERGGFTSLFIADVLGLYDVYRGGPESALRDGIQVPVGEPTLAVPAMAAVTEHLGFGVTVSLTYEKPYAFARRFGTLDHYTRGRIAWNVVTSYLESAARNLGLEHQVPHDERYEVAEEFMEVVYQLWEG
ncbi:MAG TPA: LLM class flavin-dependent oxidoreductase, partial [Pseudonocardia sp.]|nr:LLM class flavin-dependent oxidoreductase [Pseudonocardia sp.]